MEHARLNFLTLDPAAVGDLVHFVEAEARKRVEDELGNRGMAMLVDEELGVAVIETFWVSGDAMRESERAGGPLDRVALERRAATVSVEHYEVPSVARLGRPERGAGVRFTRADLDPRRIDDVIADYEDTALPWLIETDGFYSAMLLVNRRTGRAVEEAVWRDTATLAATRGAAAAIRADAAAATDSVVLALEEYRLQFRSILP
jgi:hypothetical protein